MTALLRLFATETRRFFARRVVRGMGLLALLAVLVGTGIATGRSGFRTVTRYESMAPLPEACFVGISPGRPESTLPAACEPKERRVRADERLRVTEDYPDAIQGSSIALLLVSVLLGASFIGAEYGSASLGTQLLFEPRRALGYAVKALGLAFGVACFTTAVLAVLGGALYGGAAARGITAGVDGAWLADRAGDVGRVAGVCVLGAAMSFAITSVTRHTVAAVLGLGAVGAILEPVLHSNFAAVRGWLPVTSLFVLAFGDVRSGPQGFTSLTRAAEVAGLWSAGLLLAGGFLFTRREIR